LTDHVLEILPCYKRLISEKTLGGTGDETSLAQAAKWLSTCDNEHNECIQTLGNSALPSRWVDLGIGNDTATVRLCSREEIHPNAVYMTLSHCWGSKPMLKLESHSLAAFRSRIPIEQSKTYSEAVFVARRLGVRYLWIDSLCIIQGTSAVFDFFLLNRVLIYSQIQNMIGGANLLKWATSTKAATAILLQVPPWTVRMGALITVIPRFLSVYW